MTLSFTAIGENAVQHDFSCDLSSLEDALDILNIIVFQGHTLVQAHIIEEGKRTELPSEVFDGRPVTDSIRKLEKQWRAALKKPIRSPLPLNNRWRQDMNRQRIRLYDDKIEHYTVVINLLKEQAQLAETVIQSYQRRNKLIRHYEAMISGYEGYIARTKTDRQVLLDKLRQLEQNG